VKLRPSETHIAKCKEYAERLIPVLRETAKAAGYALGVHGSLARDIDLIACPWTDEAVDAVELARLLQLKTCEVIGAALLLPCEDDSYFLAGTPGAKPHGRRGWTFHLGGGPYVDLAVMPRAPCEDGVHAREAYEAAAAAGKAGVQPCLVRD
jgi:hypothetical protein